jgi:preprotein translocase subunit SecF
MNFDFMKFKKISYSISILLSILTFIYIGIYKFNFGIDFIGGIVIELKADTAPDLPKMREVMNKLNIGEIILQNFGSPTDLSIRVGSSSEENLVKNIDLIKKTLSENFTQTFEYRKVDFVGPQVGAELIKSGVLAMIFSFMAIMFYIWIRFEWYFGLGILIALVHDVILSLGFMSVANLDFNLSTIAAILTIIGYSVNDSVVIYDRIRENLRKSHKKIIIDVINVSINETLSRTIMTVLTTLLANLALVFFGGEAIRSFSLLVFVGIIAGTYSSIFISAPILTLFVKRSKN